MLDIYNAYSACPAHRIIFLHHCFGQHASLSMTVKHQSLLQELQYHIKQRNGIGVNCC
eukprot:Gb_26003 [translate_table: standard]